MAEQLFGEAPSRVLVSVRPDQLQELARRATAAGVWAQVLGATGGSELVRRRAGAVVAKLDLGKVRDARERCLEGIVGA